MSVSSLSLAPTILSPAIQHPQASQPVQAAGDNDGDSDDFGGPADVDSASSGHRIDIKA